MAEQYDVIVAGGGVSGCAAALSARREGKSVLLIEKTITLGGLATIGLINLFVPMCNGRGKQIIKGMCDEFVRLSQKYGWAQVPDEWKNGEPEGGASARYICRYSPYPFALSLLEALTDAGVHILFDSIVSDACVVDGQITSVTILNKSGSERCCARMFIDATGDADLCHVSGAPTIQGENYFTYVAYKATLDSCRRAVEENDISLLTSHTYGGDANLYGGNHPAGMKTFSGVSSEEVSEFIALNQLKLLENIKGQNPKERDITTLPAMAQFRTTRHLLGEYTLKTEDVFTHREDSICLINDFDNRDNLYEVPFGCLVNRQMKNLFAAGRAASAQGYAWDVLRVIPPAILTGQAAGIAASHAIDEGAYAYNVSVPALQAALMEKNVLIHFTEEMIP